MIENTAMTKFDGQIESTKVAVNDEESGISSVQISFCNSCSRGFFRNGTATCIREVTGAFAFTTMFKAVDQAADITHRRAGMNRRIIFRNRFTPSEGRTTKMA